MTHRIAIRSLSSVSEDTVEVERRSPLNWKFLEDDRPKQKCPKLRGFFWDCHEGTGFILKCYGPKGNTKLSEAKSQISISRQRGSRYIVHAGRNLLAEEFCYLRDITAAVWIIDFLCVFGGQNFTCQRLNAPSSKETGIAKRRLVHDGSRLTKRLPEHPKQNIKICAHHPLTVFKGVSVDARTVKFSGKLWTAWALRRWG